MPQTVTFQVLSIADISHILVAGINVNSTYQIIGGSVFWCDTTSGSFTITLPDARLYPDRQIIFKKIASANTLTIDTLLSQTIDGVATQSITAQYDAMTVVSDRLNWGIT